MTRAGLVLLIVLAASAARGQPTSFVYVPANQPASGPCSALPLGVPNAGSLTRVPANLLTGTPWNVLHGIAFATCQSAAWTMNGVLVVGHLPPGPISNLTVPVISNGVVLFNGAFQDLALVHSSELHGPLLVSGVVNAWSPLVLPATSLFVWDGVRDIGIWLGTGTNAGGVATLLVRADPAITSLTPSNVAYAGPILRLAVSQRAAPSVSAIANTCLLGPSGSIQLRTVRPPFLGTPIFDIWMDPVAPSWLYVASGPATSPVPFSATCQILIDPVSAQQWIASGVSPLVAAPIPNFVPWSTTPQGSRWTFAIPALPSLAGQTLAVQGALSVSGTLFLTDALLLTLN